MSSVVPQPFLQTVDLVDGSGVRQPYPIELENVAPLIRLAFQTTPGIGGSTGTALGFFRIKAKYSVRGRRADILPVSIRVSMMTDKEKEEALRCLTKERLTN